VVNSVYALVPAGGRSQRMGRPKLALPLGGRSVLEHVVAALRSAGVAEVLVVVSQRFPQLVPLAASAGAHVHLLTEETPDMRATVKEGLGWLERQFRPHPEDGWLLVPADHPTLAPDVVRALLRASADHPDRSIFIPTFEGKRGHPALIGWKHAGGVRALRPGKGLNVYFRRNADETLEVSVASAEVLRDLDTPEDYERLQREWRSDS
jgi:molybdenum cofactor cytidylyltransferase